MRRVRAVLVALLVLAHPFAGAASLAEPPRGVLEITMTGPITGGTAEYVKAGLERAKSGGFSAVLIRLDTPGGALDATREIVQAMLASPVPVLVWVGPAGAQAASAGVFVTLAADVAAMDPTSNIGAAHPVLEGGKDVAEGAGKDMAKKIENDTAAFARTVAESRGHNATWAEQAVRESVSVTAAEALKLKVVDLIANSPEDLLKKANGRAVRATPTGSRTLDVAGAVLVPFEQTVRQRLVSFLADPNVLAVLMLLGTLGIGIEFYHPGVIFPGAAGALAFFLAFLGMRVVPVNVGAVVLVIIGAALLVSEAYIVTHGVAGIAGVVCIVLGTLFFVDRSSPDYQFDPGAFAISPLIVWPTPVVLGGVLMFLAWKVAAVRRRPPAVGQKALLGEPAEALSDIGPAGGEVFLHGEYWHAVSEQRIPKGTAVKVAAIDGLVVTVVAERVVNG